MKRILNLLMLFIVVGIIFNFTNVSAAVLELKTGTYNSINGHTIVINSDNTMKYDDTYSLTLSKKDRGSTVTGKIGTDNKTVTLYQINDSKLVTDNGHITYKHGGVNTYLYNFTVFSLNTTPVVLENSGIELYRNGSKVNSYADIQSAVDAANNGDTIKLTKNIDVTSGTYINKNIKLDGNGKTLNTKNWANGLFVIEKGVSFEVNNLTVDGGSTGFKVNYDAVTYKDYTIPLVSGSDSSDIKQNLPVFINLGDLKINNSNMNNNYTNVDGSVIRNISGNLYLENSNFVHNRANKGGAVAIGSYFETGQNEYPTNSVVIDNCVFENNYSSNGGAIFGYNLKEIAIKDSDFISNTVTTGYGGAILFNKQSSTAESKGLDFIQAEIDNCNFDGNWAGNDGFAIQNYDAELITTNSVFKNNVGVNSGSSVATYSMQLVRNKWATESIIGTKFINNKGSISGVADHGGYVFLNIEDCDFEGNIGMSTVYVLTSIVNIKNCNFKDEQVTRAVVDGASYSELEEYDAIEFKNATIILEDTTFNNCGPVDALSSIQGYDLPFSLVINGNVKANVEVWGKSLLTINGNLDGNVTLDRDAKVDSNILGDGEIKGKTITNPGKYRFMFRYNIGTSEQTMKYDQKTVYLDENKTYTVKEILEALDFLGKEGYKFEYYSDTALTTPWDFTLTTNEVVYGKWVEHTHDYTNGAYSRNNAIHGQCECGYLGKTLSIDIKDELYDRDIIKDAKIINELGINENDYVVSYMIKNNDGTWSNYEGTPNKIGNYKVVLTYKGTAIEKEYKIVATPVQIPNTIDNISSLIIMFISGIIGLIVAIGVSIKSKKVCEE